MNPYKLWKWFCVIENEWMDIPKIREKRTNSNNQIPKNNFSLFTRSIFSLTFYYFLIKWALANFPINFPYIYIHFCYQSESYVFGFWISSPHSLFFLLNLPPPLLTFEWWNANEPTTSVKLILKCSSILNENQSYQKDKLFQMNGKSRRKQQFRSS